MLLGIDETHTTPITCCRPGGPSALRGELVTLAYRSPADRELAPELSND